MRTQSLPVSKNLTQTLFFHLETDAMLARDSGTQWFQWHLQPDSVGSSSINTIIESQISYQKVALVLIQSVCSKKTQLQCQIRLLRVSCKEVLESLQGWIFYVCECLFLLYVVLFYVLYFIFCQLVLMLTCSVCKGCFPYIHLELSLLQPFSIVMSFHYVLLKRVWFHLYKPFQVEDAISSSPPQPSFTQIRKTQFLQPILTLHVLQTLDSLCSVLWDFLQVVSLS